MSSIHFSNVKTPDETKQEAVGLGERWQLSFEEKKDGRVRGFSQVTLKEL